jgi:hypothetical protein
MPRDDVSGTLEGIDSFDSGRRSVAVLAATDTD